MGRAFIVVLAALALSACGNESSDPGSGISGAGGFVGAGGGGPAAGGLGTATGGASAACSPGQRSACACSNGTQGNQTCDATGRFGACACDAPQGSLVCGGKQCRTGGHCTVAGLCPGFLGDCFPKTAG